MILKLNKGIGSFMEIKLEVIRFETADIITSSGLSAGITYWTRGQELLDASKAAGPAPDYDSVATFNPYGAGDAAGNLAFYYSFVKNEGANELVITGAVPPGWGGFVNPVNRHGYAWFDYGGSNKWYTTNGWDESSVFSPNGNYTN